MSVRERIQALVRGFRTNGHLIARIDPLRGYQSTPLNEYEPIRWHSRDSVADLKTVLDTWKAGSMDLSSFQLEDIPSDERFEVGPLMRNDTNNHWTLSELVGFLIERYCESVSVEYMHMDSKEQVEWLRGRIEGSEALSNGFSDIEKRMVLRQLMKADLLEGFLSETFPAAKKFGIEGSWSVIPGLFGVLQQCAEMGVEYFEIGMTHRGRLNVIINILQKPMRTVMRSFLRYKQARGGLDPFHGGDVQYHLGAFSKVSMADNNKISQIGNDHNIFLSLCPNPSHLESINPVVMGKVRAKQNFLSDENHDRVLGISLHGDASFSGQGVVHETMELSNLDAYTVGGMVHIVINNQIGFTTDPRTGRSSVHPTNVAKAIGAPVFHVNGDDVLGVVRCCRLAGEFRQIFKRDAVVNIVSYRKHGHNELDDPRITHPLTYDLIGKHRSTLNMFTDKMVSEGCITEQQIVEEKEQYLDLCRVEFEASQEYQPDASNFLMSNWQGDAMAANLTSQRPFNQTGVDHRMFEKVGKAVSTIPKDFQAHPKVAQIYKSRRNAIETGKSIDFALAEALAFGTLMLPYKAGDEAEGKRGRDEDLMQRPMEKNAFLRPMVDHPTVHVRLSGQDVERGTFNQRHAAIIDQDTAARFVPLNHIDSHQGTFDVCNSSLSEEAVLGFEYGYSLENDNALVIWEAQFGDFANNAQAIIDNFIASGEDKWLCQSGLVVLLPHGYEGQGPEHSSARLERYLQLVNEDPEDANILRDDKDLKHIMDMFTQMDSDEDGMVTLGELLSAAGQDSDFESIVEFQSLPAIFGNEDEKDGVQIRMSDYIKIMKRWIARNEEATYNISVCNVTTPANYFHVLRRQIHRPYAKPLVLMSPKYLLHHAPAVSNIQEFMVGTSFDRVISDRSPMNNLRKSFEELQPVLMSQVSKVLICSGKIAYSLHHARKTKNARDVVIVRLEQLAPFPVGEMTGVLANYPNAEMAWVQEEPKNMGAYNHVRGRLISILEHLCVIGRRNNGSSLMYIGRSPSASTATGAFEVHMEESRKIVDDAFGEWKVEGEN